MTHQQYLFIMWVILITPWQIKKPQNPKNRVCQRAWKSQMADLGLLSPLYLFNLPPFCPSWLLWLRNRQLLCCKDNRMAKVWQKGVIFVETEWTLSTCTTAPIDSVILAFAWKLTRDFPWYSGSVFLVWASIFVLTISEGESIVVRTFTHPFLLGSLWT